MCIFVRRSKPVIIYHSTNLVGIIQEQVQSASYLKRQLSEISVLAVSLGFIFKLVTLSVLIKAFGI